MFKLGKYLFNGQPVTELTLGSTALADFLTLYRNISKNMRFYPKVLG